MGFRDRAIAFAFGDDIFISYSRADGASYAARLANELAKRGFSCRFDQWASRPGAEVPPELLRALSRSGLLVIVCTAAAGVSGSVRTEIQHFLPTGRNIVPIDLDGTIRRAQWLGLVDGLAVAGPEPLSGVMERIENAANFTRRNARLTRLAIGAMIVFGVLAILIAAAGERAREAFSEAAVMSRRAETARGLAQEEERLAGNAEAVRKDAEGRRATALAQLETTKQDLAVQTAAAQSLTLAA